MVERRKFQRKKRPAAETDAPEPAEVTSAARPAAAPTHRRKRRRTDAAQTPPTEAVTAERTRSESASDAQEAARVAAARRAERAREAMAQRKAEEARLAEEQRQAAAQREAERLRVEQARAAEEAENARRAEDAERARLADEARRQQEAEHRAQEQREAEARAAEAARKAEQLRLAEAAREAEIARATEKANRDAEAAASEARQIDEARQALRAQRAARRVAPADDADVDDRWARLGSFPVDPAHLQRHRIVTALREDPAHAAFDVLRTRLLQALADNGWKRVAITSPTKDCGKTFTAANLAISLSRQQNCRTLLLDCDMRRPSLHKVMGLRDPGSMGDMLRGGIPPEDHFQRIAENRIHAGDTIAFGFNGAVEPYASELLQSPETARTLQRIEDRFAPDVMLFDLPPALYYDDVIAFRPLFDGVLLVVGGGLTTEKEVREVERRLGESTPLLGTVLNRAEGTSLKKYSY